MTAQPEPQPEAAPAMATRDGRVVTIDILRGLAILWVITFHLWADQTAKQLAGPRFTYEQLRDRIGAGDPLATLTAAGEVVLGTGFHGVSLFMILSGVALTLNAYTRKQPGVLQGYITRTRKLVIPYWCGVLMITGTIGAVALLQMWLDGGTFREQWWNVHINPLALANVRWQDVAWALTVVGWLFQEKLALVPVGSMWFVVLLLQYYLIFPYALRLLDRIGPWRMIVLGIVITLVSRWLMITVGDAFIDPAYQSRSMLTFAPFRIAEFTTGMAIGWALVHRREETGAWVRSPFDITGIIVVAFLMQMGGSVMGADSNLAIVLGDPMVQLGMALYALPLLFKIPGQLEVSALAKIVVFVGVISFPVLIVNDCMRLFATFLRLQDIPNAIWWFFLVVVYVPVGVLLAYPLGVLWGFVPGRRRGGSTTVTPAQPELQPAGGG